MVIKRILVPLDFSRCAGRALKVALDLASTFHASVSVLHVVWDPPPYASEVMPDWTPSEETMDQARTRLEQTLAQEQLPEGVRCELLLGAGESYEVIVERAREGHFDLVVMGTHGRSGLPRLLLGSVAERVLRLCPVPVMTVRDEACGKDQGLSKC